MAANTHDFDVEDVEYLRHGSEPFLMRIYRPHGQGPFPVFLEAHGGAWCNSDRLADAPLHEALARGGVLVAAPDFRQGWDAPYPAGAADLNYAIRWLKLNARELGGRSDGLGFGGNSSGGHYAMLLGMRPRDPRYCALPLPAGAPAVDASIRCVVMVSPVIDPIGRYRTAKRMKAEGKPFPDVIPAHDAYWQTEEAMAEGSPLRALERGEAVELPPTLCVSRSFELAHPREYLDRFVAGYREAGGALELCMIDQEGASLATSSSAPGFDHAVKKIVEFLHAQLG
jgi:acetyl esterase